MSQDVVKFVWKCVLILVLGGTISSWALEAYSYDRIWSCFSTNYFDGMMIIIPHT